MTASRAAAALVALAGLAWIVAGITADAGELANDPAVYVVGLVLLLLGLVAFGYSLVTTAPVWLRVVVAVATPALGYVVWAAIWDGVDEGRDEAVLVAGPVLVVVAALGLMVGARRVRRTS